MSSTHVTRTESDTLPEVSHTLDTAEDPTGGSVTLRITEFGTDTNIVNDTGSIDSYDSSAGTAEVSYQLSADQTANVGLHRYQWIVQYTDGDEETLLDVDDPSTDPWGFVEFEDRLPDGTATPGTSARVGPNDVYLFNELAEDPNAPAADDWGVFFQDDGNLYKIDEDATVTPVGADVSVEDDGTEILASATTLDFGGSQFDVTNPSGSDALIQLGTDVIGTDEFDQTAAYTLTGGVTFDKYLDLEESGANPAHAKGRVFYDNTEEAVSVYNEDANITHALGREVLLRVRNETGSTLSNGDVVYVDGAHSGSGHPTVALAQADSATTSEALGMVTSDIGNNDFGYVTRTGVVHGLDTSSFSAGDAVYLSASSAGAITSTEPSSPNFSVEIGVVTQASASSGNIAVVVESGREGIYTQGAIPFAGSGGTLIEDSSNLHWDNTNDRLGVGTDSPTDDLDVRGVLRADPELDNASERAAKLGNTRATPADNDEAYASLVLNDDGNNETEAARLTWELTDVTDGTEDGDLILDLVDAGTLTEQFRFTSGGNLALGSGSARIHTAGGGTDTTGIRDASRSEDFAVFNETDPASARSTVNKFINVPGDVELRIRGNKARLDGITFYDESGNQIGGFGYGDFNDSLALEAESGEDFGFGIAGTGSLEMEIQDTGVTRFDRQGTTTAEHYDGGQVLFRGKRAIIADADLLTRSFTDDIDERRNTPAIARRTKDSGGTTREQYMAGTLNMHDLVMA